MRGKAIVVRGTIQALGTYPLPGSWEFIYLRTVTSDVLQFFGDGLEKSELPVGMMLPTSGVGGPDDLVIDKPRSIDLVNPSALAVSFVAVVGIGDIKDFALSVGLPVSVQNVAGGYTLEVSGRRSSAIYQLNNSAFTVSAVVGAGGYNILSISHPTKAIALKAFDFRTPLWHPNAAALTSFRASIERNAGDQGTAGQLITTASGIQDRMNSGASGASIRLASGTVTTPSGAVLNGAAGYHMPVNVAAVAPDRAKYRFDLTAEGMGPAICQAGQSLSVQVFFPAVASGVLAGDLAIMWEEI